MVNPGTFRGSRNEFFLGEREAYSAAVSGGYVKDALALISRRYFKRYPIDLPLDEEPSAEHLAAINDDVLEPEEPPLDPFAMTSEEFEKELERLKERSSLISFRQAQIKRRMAYLYMKDNDVDPNDTGVHNPYRILLFKLTGKGYQPPRLKSGCNLWRLSHRELINEQAAQREFAKKDSLAIRDRIAKEEFGKLEMEEQREWAVRAMEEHAVAKAKFEADIAGPPSTDPEERQKCIQGLSKFMKPILDLVAGATGWNVSLIAGGPEPAEGGRLNMMSIHSGTTTGDVKMNFGRFEHRRYQQYIVPTYGNFLKNCFDPVECRSRALPATSGFDSLDALNADALGVNLDTIAWAVEAEPAVLAAPTTPSPTTAPASVAATGATSVIVNASGAGLTSSDPPSQLSTIGPAPPPVESTTPTLTLPMGHNPLPSLAVGEELPPAFDIPPSPVLGPEDMPEPHAASPPPSPAPSPPPSPAPSSRPLVGSGNTTFTTLPTHRLSQSPPTANNGLGTVAIPSADLPSSTSSTTPVGPDKGDHAVPKKRKRRSSTDQNNAVTSLVAPLELSAQIAPAKRRSSGRATTSSKKRKATTDDDPQSAASAAVTPNSEPTPRATGRAAMSMPNHPSSASPVFDASSEPAVKRARRANVAIAHPISAPTVATPNTAAGEPAAKRQRKTTSKSDAWRTSAISMLRAEDLGPVWTQLVDAWVAFEEQECRHSSDEQCSHDLLSAAGRPTVVHDWIGRARRVNYRPTVSVDTFEAEFLGWWKTLQPDWRISDNDIVMDGVLEGDWTKLRVPGKNGLLSVVAALFFWGFTVKDAPEKSAWQNATTNCVRVVTQMLQ